jgi:hypothetical protein
MASIILGKVAIIDSSDPSRRGHLPAIQIDLCQNSNLDATLFLAAGNVSTGGVT